MRRYGKWAGNPQGEPEDPELCVAEVPNYPAWAPRQCSRKRGHGPEGLYCRQHGQRKERGQAVWEPGAWGAKDEG